MRNFKQKNYKNNRASISLFVLVSMLFFAIVVLGFYIAINNRVSKQETDVARIEQSYRKENIDVVYNNALKQPDQLLFPELNKSETDPESALPENYKTIIEDEPSKGIVIKDANDNEWTWVIVPKTTTVYTTAGLGITRFNDTNLGKIQTDLINYATDYREGKTGQGCNWSDKWYAKDGNTIITEDTSNLTSAQKALKNGCGLTYDEYKSNYQKMLISIYKNGGFWVAKYEAGIEGTDISLTNARSSYSSIVETSPKAVSKQNMIPYNYVYCDEAQELASKMSTEESKISSLLFGIQWDLVCKYIEENAVNIGSSNILRKEKIKTDSALYGNYRDSSLKLSRGKYSTRRKWRMDSV